MVKLQRLGKLDGHHHDVCSCDFSPDGALLATASYDTRVVVWDPHTCTKLLELWYIFFYYLCKSSYFFCIFNYLKYMSREELDLLIWVGGLHSFSAPLNY